MSGKLARSVGQLLDRFGAGMQGKTAYVEKRE